MSVDFCNLLGYYCNWEANIAIDLMLIVPGTCGVGLWEIKCGTFLDKKPAGQACN